MTATDKIGRDYDPSVKKLACATCNTVTNNVCRVCDSCIESRTTAERLSQGLPAKVEDAATYERLGVLMRRAG